MPSVTLTVPGLPPSVNHQYRRFTHQGRTMNVITREAERYASDAAIIAGDAVRRAGWQMPMAGEKVVIRLWFWWPDRRRRDTHNALKLLLDAWEGVLYGDDRYALPRIMDWQVDKERPRIEAEIRLLLEMGEEAGA